MIKAVDHAIILVADLATAVADYQDLGFTVVPGGEHFSGGTHNALIAFTDDTYLELIAYKDGEPDPRWWGHVANTEGLVDYALQPSALEEDMAAAAARGVHLSGPHPGGRRQPDGQRVECRIGTPLATELPFLCADVASRRLRVPTGDACNHANRVRGIAGITVAVNDLDASAARYQALLGIAPAPQLPQSGAISFRLGTTIIGLTTLAVSPTEGIHALALDADRGDPLALELTKAHGARIVLI